MTSKVELVKTLDEYTAIIKQDGDWWIGWIQEVPGVNCQEATREELLETLRITLGEMLELNRKDAVAAAGEGYQQEQITVGIGEIPGKIEREIEGIRFSWEKREANSDLVALSAEVRLDDGEHEVTGSLMIRPPTASIAGGWQWALHSSYVGIHSSKVRFDSAEQAIDEAENQTVELFKHQLEEMKHSEQQTSDAWDWLTDR